MPVSNDVEQFRTCGEAATRQLYIRPIEHGAMQAQQFLRRSLQESKERDGHGEKQPATAGGGGAHLRLLVLLLRLHHRLLPSLLVVV